MTIELNLLKVMSEKESYNQYLPLINTKTLSIQSIEILKDYAKYFEKYNKDSVDFGEFKEFFFIVQHPNLDEKNEILYKEVFNQLEKLDSVSIGCAEVIKAFEQSRVYQQLQQDIDNNVDVSSLYSKIENLKARLDTLDNSEIKLNMDLREALEYTNRGSGLKWRLECLNQHFGGGIIKGDFILLAGYVDSGKTGFCASELSYMAQQLQGDEYILWLNTEGNWQQILPRIYQATLNCTRQDLKNHADTAILKYTEKMNGDKNRIQVLNFQRKTTMDVEQLIKKRPPKVLVFDLLDHIQGFKNFDNDVTEKYGHLYQWARVIATEYCPVIAISQLNRNGNDNPYPPMTELSGSGEKKQAAATAMIMLGSVQGNDTERYLSTPKNKIGGGKGFRAVVKFDPLRCRFSD